MTAPGNERLEGAEGLDREVAQIMAANLAGMVGRSLIAIVTTSDGFVIHQHTLDSVAPQTTYPSARAAASRVLQLLSIGPVAPQTWPEEACISEVTHDAG